MTKVFEPVKSNGEKRVCDTGHNGGKSAINLRHRKMFCTLVARLLVQVPVFDNLTADQSAPVGSPSTMATIAMAQRYGNLNCI